MIHTGHGRRRAGRGNPRGVSRLPTSMSKDAARYVHFNLDDVPESGNVLTDVSSMAVGFTRERERGGEGGDHGASPPRRADPACSSWPAGRHLPYHCGCFRYTVRSGDARARRERALKVGQASGASFSPRLDPLAVRVSKTLIRQTFCELGGVLDIRGRVEKRPSNRPGPAHLSNPLGGPRMPPWRPSYSSASVEKLRGSPA